MRPIRFLNFINQNLEINGRYFLIAENRNQKSGLRKSEIRNPKTENGNQKSEIRKRKSEMRNPKSEIRNPKSEIRNPKSELQNPKSEIRNQKSEIRNQKSEIRNPKSEIGNRKSEIGKRKTEIRKQKSEIGKIRNQKSKIRLSKGTWRDVITLQPSSQDHDKKPILRLTCPQVSSLHTRHKEFVPSALWRVYYSVGLHVKTRALLLHWEWRRKLKIFLTLVASWETFNSTCRQNFRKYAGFRGEAFVDIAKPTACEGFRPRSWAKRNRKMQ